MRLISNHAGPFAPCVEVDGSTFLLSPPDDQEYVKEMRGYGRALLLIELLAALGWCVTVLLDPSGTLVVRPWWFWVLPIVIAVGFSLTIPYLKRARHDYEQVEVTGHAWAIDRGLHGILTVQTPKLTLRCYLGMHAFVFMRRIWVAELLGEDDVHVVLAIAKKREVLEAWAATAPFDSLEREVDENAGRVWLMLHWRMWKAS